MKLLKKRDIVIPGEGAAMLADAIGRIAQPSRRAFLQRSLTLGGLTLLTGCATDDSNVWARSVGADPAAIAGFGYAATLTVGAPAELVLFRARSWTELMSRPQADRIVLRGGAAIDTTLPDYRELDDLMGPRL